MYRTKTGRNTGTCLIVSLHKEIYNKKRKGLLHMTQHTFRFFYLFCSIGYFIPFIFCSKTYR